MAGLAEAIGAMTVSMATMSERLEKQTGEADRQIEEAVRRFGQASDEMRTAFGDLNRNFGVIADRMREENEQASALARQRMDELLTSLGSTLDDMKAGLRSEEHTSELQSLMRISYAVFCLKKKQKTT